MNYLGKTLIIAEAGVNHDGVLGNAVQLIEKAAEAGADFVKFQTFRAEAISSSTVSKANYQLERTDANESQREMLRRLELSRNDHYVLVARCRELGIEFLSSAFDLPSLDFLANDLGLSSLKIGSGEITNAPLLLAAARTHMSLILSTGMSSLAEVEEALGVLAFGMSAEGMPCGRADFAHALLDQEAWARLRERVTLLHCTTEYPAPVADTNLRAIDTMRQAFSLPVGYSDHTDGMAMVVAAVARGATVIEKHLTLDKRLPGPDHAASMEPQEFAELVRAVRSVEIGLGSGIKQPMPSELKNRSVARKCVVASRELPEGRRLTLEDLTTMRASGELSGMSLWDCVGRSLKRSVPANAALSWDVLG